MTTYTQTLTEKVVSRDSYANPQSGTSLFILNSSTWVKVNGIKYYKIEKRLNQMSQFKIEFSPVSPTSRAYIKEFAKVMFFSGDGLILKGRIQKVSYETAYSVSAEGFGMEATILDKEYRNSNPAPAGNPEDEDRVQYDNVSAQSIAKYLLSTNGDGVAPWTMTPRSYGLFATDYGVTSMRFEYANKLTALGNLANALNYDWWVDHSPISYDTDYFNIAPIKGNQTTPTGSRIFVIGTQCRGTDYQKDVTNIANYVKVIGYGDGINQLFTATFNASPIWTTLSANISASDTTIPLVSNGQPSHVFPNSGDVRIADEIVHYTGNTGTSLTGCTRGYSGTTAKIHRAGCYLEKNVAYTSPEAVSSLAVNGLMELTLTHRDIRDESTLELVASHELIDRMEAIERINIIPNSASSIAKTIQTGDLIHIEDAGSGIDGDFRTVGIIYENSYGNLKLTLEASNKSLTFIEQMQKEREKNQALQKYMQGSTNVYVVSNSENCDNGYGCVIKTYIPPEALAINHVILSYDVSAYRIYNTTTANESAHTHGIPSLTVNGTSTTSTSIGHTHDVDDIPDHQHPVFFHESYPNPAPSSVDEWTACRNGYSGGITAYFATNNSYDIYTDATVVQLGASKTTVSGGGSHSHSVNASSTATNTSNAGSAHNHGVSYGITTGTNTITDMQIYVNGSDRTAAIEAAIGHTLSVNSTEAEIDVTQWITSGWNTIDIRPNGTCRITGDMWNQVFIESK